MDPNQQNLPQEQNYNLKTPPNYSNQSTGALTGKKIGMLVGILALMIAVIVGFFMLNGSSKPDKLDKIIINQQNLLTIVAAAEDIDDNYDLSQAVINAKILINSDLSDLDSYRNNNYSSKVSKDLSAQLLDSDSYENKFDNASQAGNITEVFLSEINPILESSLDELDKFEDSTEELNKIIEQTEENLKSVRESFAEL